MKMITTFLISVSLLGCQPQQTDIFSQTKHPDGSVSTYVNKSSGYGYNPNTTQHYNGPAPSIVQPSYPSTIYYYHRSPFTYVPGCVTTPGAMPIPQNIGIYNYNPTVYWGGYYYHR